MRFDLTNRKRSFGMKDPLQLRTIFIFLLASLGLGKIIHYSLQFIEAFQIIYLDLRQCLFIWQPDISIFPAF
jgi:hypothetical protein